MRTNQSFTLAKGLAVLNCFIDESDLSMSEIVTKSALNKSVVQRLINTLLVAGYLRQDKRTRRYYLGLDLITLGASARRSMRLRQLALPFMSDIARETGAVINLNLLDRTRWLAVCVESIDGAERIRYSMNLGERGFLHAGATRKVIMAFLPEDERQKVVDLHGLPMLSPSTCTQAKELEKQLEVIRGQGWSVTYGESDASTPPASACAVPLLSESSYPLGSLGAIGPAHRMSPENIENIKGMLLAAGSAIQTGITAHQYEY